jgi:hypothetical protein
MPCHLLCAVLSSGLQITTPRLFQLLWSSCQPAMQQLLQPLPSQLLGLNSVLAAAAATAAGGSSKGSGSSSNISQQVPAALGAAQEQLSLLTAGAVSSGSALLVRLLQLGAVLVPEGPLGVSSSNALGSSSEAAAAAAAMQAAFPAVSDQGRAARWLLLPAQQSDAAGASSSGSQHEQQQQQQAGQFLVFRSAPDPSMLHVLPLNLAVGVLQLMQHLACLDGTCLSVLAAELSSSSSSSGSGSGQPGSLQRQPSSSGGSLQGSGGASRPSPSDGGSSSSSSSRVRIEWGPQGPAAGSASAAGSAQQAVAQHVQQQLRHSSGERAQKAVYSSAGFQAAAVSRSGSGTGSLLQQEQQQRSLGLLLGDAARSHGLLLQQVGALLAAVAAELPVAQQPVLLNITMSDQGLLVLLLQADSCVGRCAAAALLQHMLACPAVLAAMSGALSGTAKDQQQQQRQDCDVIMIDVEEDQTTGTALQPLNNRGNNRTPAAGNSRQGKAPPQQQQQQQGLTAAAAAAAAAAGNAQQQPQQVLRAHVVQEVLMQLLQCFSYGLDEAFHALQQPAQQQQQQQQHAPAVLHATSSSNSRAGSQWTSSRGGVAYGQAAAAGRGAQPVQGWGAFELQRRCCAVYAGLLHSRQEALLQYSMDAEATAGEDGAACMHHLRCMRWVTCGRIMSPGRRKAAAAQGA